MALTLNGTTGIAGIAGSAGTPALQGNNDANTGYFFGTDTLGLSTAGSERLRITSDGDVGIGVSPSSGIKLHIKDTTSDGAIKLEGTGSTLGTWITLQNNDATANSYSMIQGADAGGQGTSEIKFINVNNSNNEGTLTVGTRPSGGSMQERLRITSTGRLLLGTAVDSLFNGGRNASFQQEGTTAATSAFAITRNSNDANPAYISFGKSRGTSVGANTAVQNGDVIGTIEFNAGDGSGSFNCHALIKGSVDAAPGNNDAPGRLSFWTTPDGGSTTPLERLCITSDGKTVIGHTAVSGWQNSTQLQVLTDSSVGGITTCRYNNTYGGYGLTLARSKTSTIGAHGQVTSGQNIGHIQFVGSDGSAFRALGDITCAADGNVTSTSAEGKIIFKTSKSASVTPTQAMTIKSNHNIEIHDGNIVFETSGNGIDFSAAAGSNAGSSSALLDDYEEGTFTLSFGTSGTNFSTNPTLSQNNCRYTKIGNTVTISAYVGWGTQGAGGSGDLRIAGLPFTQNSAAVYNGAYFGWYSFSGGFDADTILQAYVSNGSTFLTLLKTTTGDTSPSYATVPHSAVVGLSGTYQLSLTYSV